MLVLNHDGVHDGHVVQNTPSTVLTTLRLANGETMPTLDAYLAAAKRTKVHLVLELKPHATPEAETAAAEAAVKAVEAAKLTKARNLHHLLAPRHGGADPPGAEERRALPGRRHLARGARSSGLPAATTTTASTSKHPEWLEYMKQHGMISNVWTVNHPVDMIWAMRQKIDFLTTDRPDLFLQLQGK